MINQEDILEGQVVNLSQLLTERDIQISDLKKEKELLETIIEKYGVLCDSHIELIELQKRYNDNMFLNIVTCIMIGVLIAQIFILVF